MKNEGGGLVLGSKTQVEFTLSIYDKEEEVLCSVLEQERTN